MKICVFLGPSLPRAEAEALLPAIYLPPARRGDVLDAVRAHDPDGVVVIDGYFEQVPSVWHKELLWALDQGVALFGASSMGALRAAEMAQFGMVGIGRIFEAYASGRFAPFDDPFEDDDEVAVVHGPAEIGYAASEAMVDIRASLAAAEAAGVIDSAAMIALAQAGKSLFYKHRRWATVLERGTADGIAPEFITALKKWLPENRVSQKRLDAEAVLAHISSKGCSTTGPAFRFERTLLWEDALRDRGLDGSGDARDTM